MKKACFLFLALGMLASLFCVPASALSPKEEADAMYALGLFRGNGTNPDGSPNYALDDRASRNQAAAMLIRLLGKESAAQREFASGALENPFTDLSGWAEPNVAWLCREGMINGTSPTTFSGGEAVTARQFAAIILRSLGYSEKNGDFTYASALTFAQEKGLLTAEQAAAMSADFRRSGMVEMCYHALGAALKGESRTLREKLAAEGVISEKPAPLSLSLQYAGGGHEDTDLGQWYIEEKAVSDSPCADVDGDGKKEIVFQVRSVFCLDAATGAIKWMAPSGHDVTEPGATAYGACTRFVPTMIADVNGDGKQEIVTFSTVYSGKNKTFVGIYDGSGHFLSHWETPYPVRAAKLADLDGDGKLELALGLGVGADNQTKGALAVYVHNWDGSVRAGWPRDCGYGLYSNSMEAVDLDGDGKPELVMLNDQAYINAFHGDGTPVTISTGDHAGKTWKDITVFESYAFEKTYKDGVSAIGTDRGERYSIMGTHGGIIADDLDGDGKKELVCTAMIQDLAITAENMAKGTGLSFDQAAKYFAPFLLNLDHSRYTNAAKGYDWTAWPKDVGTIVAMSDSALPNPEITPVTADLDGDGVKEILYSSFDGKVHCFSLDKQEHGSWPYTLGTGFASKPAVADLNGDGRREVIFTTYAKDNQMAQRGSLVVLDGRGAVLFREELPQGWGQGGGDRNYGYANGAAAAPVIADVNGDGRAEVIVTTYNCGVCVYRAG